MSDPTEYERLGLLKRYAFVRADGAPEDPTARLFTLRYDKPDFWGAACRATLREFAKRIEARYPQLARELIEDLDRYEAAAPR